MLQTMNGKQVYIVDFGSMPELPITAETDEEKPYAAALTGAIQTRVITKPGKYAIHLDKDDHYEIYAVADVPKTVRDRAALIRYLETDGTFWERLWLPLIRRVHRRRT